MNYNPCLSTDSYKVSHWMMDLPNTQYRRSYFECRGGDWGELTWFGLLPILQDYMTVVPSHDQVELSCQISRQHFGYDYFNSKSWHDIADMGHIPLRIMAIPEGTTVRHSNITMWIENTVPGFGWLPGWYEGLLMKSYYPSAVCTLSRNIKKFMYTDMKKHTDLSENEIEGKLKFMLHDFGYRSNYSERAACLAGMAHLAAGWLGTDTLSVIEAAMNYYGSGVCGYSVMASEHSVMTIKGRDGEEQMLLRILDVAPDDAIISIVGDSYDIFNFVTNIVGKHKERIKARKGKLVIRPDSGEPKLIVLDCLNRLGDIFGYTVNSKGKKILPPCIGLIQGDGVNAGSIATILFYISENGWSPENLVFGMGGKLHTDVNRDSHKCKIAASSITINGVDYDIFKDPVTDPGKKSKSGLLDLVVVNGEYTTEKGKPGSSGILQTVFEDGKLFNKPTWSEILERTA